MQSHNVLQAPITSFLPRDAYHCKGYEKIAIFRPISRFISEMIQDRAVSLLWKANRKLYACYLLSADTEQSINEFINGSELSTSKPWYVLTYGITYGIWPPQETFFNSSFIISSSLVGWQERLKSQLSTRYVLLCCIILHIGIAIQWFQNHGIEKTVPGLEIPSCM